MSNGRINILYPETRDLFGLYDKIPSKQPSTSYRHPTGSLWIETPLSRKFFSADNISYLQYKMHEGVLKMSNNQINICSQDEDQLKIIMRGVFLENAMNDPDNIGKQVNQLNKTVLDYAVPQIYHSAISYKKYVQDASTMYKPINHPVLTKKNKQLELKPWF